MQLELLVSIKFTNSEFDKNDNDLGVSYLSLLWEKINTFFILDKSIKTIPYFLIYYQKKFLSFILPAKVEFKAITPSIFWENLDFEVIDAQAPTELPVSTIL